MFTKLKTYCEELKNNFNALPQERKDTLARLADYITTKQQQQKEANLVYICTHNSRRSHFGQVWAKVASEYYSVKNVNTFSGGTETTAFNPNAIAALARAGFKVSSGNQGKNPMWQVVFGEQEAPIICYSKVYNDKNNPQSDFAAIMTCSDAEADCPFIQGAELRIATTYADPKIFDGTAQQDEEYDKRCRQIALETFYAFSKLI